MTFTQFADEFDLDLFEMVVGYDDIMQDVQAKADALFKEENEG
jgi:hypothetical protein